MGAIDITNDHVTVGLMNRGEEVITETHDSFDAAMISAMERMNGLDYYYTLWRMMECTIVHLNIRGDDGKATCMGISIVAGTGDLVDEVVDTIRHNYKLA